MKTEGITSPVAPNQTFLMVRAGFIQETQLPDNPYKDGYGFRELNVADDLMLPVVFCRQSPR
jgi:hypothetical protein